MLTFDRHDNRFNHRVAGACVRDGHVLLTRAEGENFSILPGGRVEFGEDTRAALAREVAEELGCPAKVGRLLWVVEDFFFLSGRRYHELAFVYEFRPADPRIMERSWRRTVTDGGTRIDFHWCPLNDLGRANLQPAYLRDALRDPPSVTTHLILREPRGGAHAR